MFNINAILEKLGDRPIAFHRAYVPIAESVDGAVFLSQMMYWHNNRRAQKDDGGFFYKTAKEWEEETGIVPRAQDRIRSILREKGIIIEKRAGVPGKLYFKVDLTAMANLLSESPNGESSFTVLDNLDSTERDNKIAPNRESLLLSETTTETKAKTGAPTDLTSEANTPQIQPPPPRYGRFSTKWKHHTPCLPSGNKTMRCLYEAACQKLGEENVLDAISKYMVGRSKEELGGEYAYAAPKRFLEEGVYQIIEADSNAKEPEEDEERVPKWKVKLAQSPEGKEWRRIYYKVPEEQRTQEEKDFISNHWEKFFNVL